MYVRKMNQYDITIIANPEASQNKLKIRKCKGNEVPFHVLDGDYGKTKLC